MVKKMKHLRNKIYVKMVNNKKNYLNWTSKLSFVTEKMFETNLMNSIMIISKANTAAIRLGIGADIELC